MILVCFFFSFFSFFSSYGSLLWNINPAQVLLIIWIIKEKNAN